MRPCHFVSHTYSQASGDSAHHDRHQVVEVSVGRLLELQRSEADVVQSLIVDTERLVRVLHQLVDGERGVVGFNDRVGNLEASGDRAVVSVKSSTTWTNLNGTYLGRRENRERRHHSVGVFLSDLGDQERSHSGSGSSSEGMGDLETLEAIGSLGFLPHNVQNRVDELGP